MRFEWDENKNKKNIQKHKIDFSDAVFVFTDPFALSIPDNQHSESEERWVTLGKNLKENVLVVVHTFRHNDVIRIISARKATKREQKTYRERSGA